MRAVVVAVLMVLSCVAQARDSVSVHFDDMPIAQLVKVVLGDILQRSYVLDAKLPDVSVSVVMPDSQPATLERELSAVLKRIGFALDCDKQVCRVVPSFSDPREVVVYQPKFRSVAYLITNLRPWFPPDAFGGAAPRVSQNTLGATQAQPMITDNGALSSSVVTSDVLSFRGSADDIGRFRGLLTQLDVAERQVYVTAMVYEVQTGAHEGSAWDILASIVQGKFGLKLDYSVADAGTTGVTVKWGDSSAFFAALSSDSHFKVLASPRVRVVSGKTAMFSVGDDVPVLGAVVTDAGGKATQSVNYKSSGVILNISAEVFGNVAKLSVSQQISQFSTTETGVAASPTLTKRELKTDLSVKPGDLVLLGGLDQQKGSTASSKLSFAKFINSKTSDDSTTQVLVFLKLESVTD